MASRISRVACILGRPVALGAGRWDSRQLHSASERSVWYAFLMLGILPSEYLRTPFQTVSGSRVLGNSDPKSCIAPVPEARGWSLRACAGSGRLIPWEAVGAAQRAANGRRVFGG